MAIGDIQIPSEIADEYYFLMGDFKAMMIDGTGTSPKAMNAYYNNFMKSHKDIKDIAAFAMALNHTELLLDGEAQTLYANLCVNVTREVYYSDRFSDEEKAAFHQYLD